MTVRNTLRRLATKVGQKPIAHGLGNDFRPIQLGFETKGGCEAVVHAARQYLNGASHRRVLLKLDVCNSFNCMRRDVFSSNSPGKGTVYVQAGVAGLS